MDDTIHKNMDIDNTVYGNNTQYNDVDNTVRRNIDVDNTNNTGQQIEKDLVIEDALSVSHIVTTKSYCYFL